MRYWFWALVDIPIGVVVRVRYWEMRETLRAGVSVYIPPCPSFGRALYGEASVRLYDLPGRLIHLSMLWAAHSLVGEGAAHFGDRQPNGGILVRPGPRT